MGLAVWFALPLLTAPIGLTGLAAFSEAHWIFINEPLYMAASDGDVDKVRSLLAWGADPDTDFEGYPTLEAAAGEGHTEIVRMLLAHGADVDVVNRWNGNTALMSARANGHTDIVRLLKEAGASEHPITVKPEL